MDNELIHKLAVTYEMVGGRPPSEAVAMTMVRALGGYPSDKLSVALDRCMSEVKGHLSMSDIISRIDDGRPGPEEAWGMVPKSEDDSVLWTKEMENAFYACYDRLKDGDLVAARMAFIEKYKKDVAGAKSSGNHPKWSFSAGHCKLGRTAVLQNAHERKLLKSEYILRQLPSGDAGQELRDKIEGELNMLPSSDDGESNIADEFAAGLANTMSLPWEKK